MKKHKQLIVGILIGGIAASTGITFAAQNVMSELADYVKFKFDGSEKQIPEGFTVLMYNDRTYVPARFVAENLGAKVDWDGNTNTVIITSANALANGGSADAKSYPVDINIASGPMKMKITKVTLNPAYKKYSYQDPFKAIIFSVEVENTSSNIVNWHPAQGTAVLNTKEQIEGGSTLFYSDDVDGEFVGNVVKKGNIVFKTTSDFKDISHITYKINGPFDDHLNRLGNDTLTDIVLK